MASWKRLIRFIAREDQSEHWGEPLSDKDIGLSHDQGELISVRPLVADDPLAGSTLASTTLTVQRLLAPVPRASYATTIRGLGAQYAPPAGHPSAGAFKAPSTLVVFLKAPTSIVGPGEPISIPLHARDVAVDYEVELAVVLGRTVKDISEADALSAVLGYTVANDISSRKLCGAGGQWGLGKNADGWCPLGPALVSPRVLTDPHALEMRARVNGDVVQSANTGEMLASVAKLISVLSAGTTLLAGTVILTGTPLPIGRPAMTAAAGKPDPWLKDGDICDLHIVGIGSLINPVRADKLKARL